MLFTNFLRKTEMNHFTVTSKPVTQNIITIEMTEETATELAVVIARDLVNHKNSYEENTFYRLQDLKNAIKGHLS